ncbi:MAG: hypothetical protein K5668_10350 [Lachnospiraceae bacterium]|nr:hypothetical protein [Lachnospiraceae bacterium]
MSNSQLYPFERNRYYPGKLLTSADFQAEQNYHINKDRFLNGLMFGSGVVCGMGVFSLDDISVLIESGVAIDGTGREIILDTSVVKKISAIDGFDKIEGDVCTLKIRYKEQDVHSVYSVNHKEDEKEYEYNRISEGYELFLTEKDEDAGIYDPDTEFLTREALFKSENFSGDVVMPANVCKGKNVKIVLVIKKVSDADVRLSCRGILEIPAFNTAEGENELEIGVEDLALNEGETYKQEYWVRVLDNDMDESELILRSGSASAFEDGNAIISSTHFALRVRLGKISPLELVGREAGRINLEMRNLENTDEAISLADIKLVRSTGNCIIESINESAAKKYILTPAQEVMRNDYLSYYEKDVDLKKQKEVAPVKTEAAPGAKKSEFTNIASGTLEVPLGRNAREGDIRYSGEIAHGLGPGNVFVQIGYDYVSDDPEMGANQKSVIYGNPGLFSQRNNIFADVETGVKVLSEKGSFVVAARLLRNVDYLVLSFRWVAIRFPSGNDMEITEDYYDRSISVDTPTVIMGTKESHFFGVRFNNMKACSITYELTNPGSGEISSDGIYTAPSKEGVYEIRIYCTDMPVICTYAYAIVKKKMLDDPGREPVHETAGAESERGSGDSK